MDWKEKTSRDFVRVKFSFLWSLSCLLRLAYIMRLMAMMHVIKRHSNISLTLCNIKVFFSETFKALKRSFLFHKEIRSVHLHRSLAMTQKYFVCIIVAPILQKPGTWDGMFHKSVGFVLFYLVLSGILYFFWLKTNRKHLERGSRTLKAIGRAVYPIQAGLSD